METILQMLGGLSGATVALSLIFLILFWPALLLYFAWRLLRDVRRIADAAEYMACATPRESTLPAPQYAESTAAREPGIGLSAFGR